MRVRAIDTVKNLLGLVFTLVFLEPLLPEIRFSQSDRLILYWLQSGG